MPGPGGALPQGDKVKLALGADTRAARHRRLWAHPHPWMLTQLRLLFSARAPLSALTLEPDLATPRSRITGQITPASDSLLMKHQCHPFPKAVVKTKWQTAIQITQTPVKVSLRFGMRIRSLKNSSDSGIPYLTCSRSFQKHLD